MNYYEFLAVSKNATEAEIRTAYRRLAQDHHPDHSGDADAIKFRKVQEAYDTLSDPKSRAAYDRRLASEIPVRVGSRPPERTVYEVNIHHRKSPWLVQEVGRERRFKGSIFEAFDRLIDEFFGF